MVRYCGCIHAPRGCFVADVVTLLTLYVLATAGVLEAVWEVDTKLQDPKDIAIPLTGEYDREELQKLTEYRQRHRKTIDGMLCAAAFVRNGNKFTDCTTTEAPDGSVGREWCYVEVQLVGVGFRDWDFCAGVVDYDVLRSKAQALSQLKVSELGNSFMQLMDKERKLKKTLSRFENVCGHHAEYRDVEMNNFTREMHGLERALKQVEANWRKIHDIRNTYESLEEKLVVSRKNALADRRNCSIVQGYYPSAIGDGIRASYFDNPYFRGPPVGFFDHENLSLVFDEVLPVSKVDIRTFSVRFEGYLKAPLTDTYTFYMDADCNFRLFIDGELVIEHGLESRGKFASNFTPVGVVALDGRSTLTTHLKSRELTLDGGRRYPIVLEYSHQSILKYRDEDVAKITLSWSTPNMPQTIVLPEYFFRSRESGETLIVSDLKARLYDLAMLENGAQAFMHVTNLVISDIPDKFRGATMIRTFAKPKEDQIQFSISHDAMVYVAQSAHSSFIPKTGNGNDLFERNTDVVSIYSTGENCEEAHEQQEFFIYHRRFKAGVINIQLPPETSYFMFLQPVLTNVVCQDEVQFLPFKNGDGCTASSSLSAGFDCEKGFGNGSWRSQKGRMKNQWLVRTFANPVDLRYFHFSAFDAGVPLKATVLFPDGSKEEFDLHSKLRYEFSHRGAVDFIRIDLEGDAYGDSGEKSETIGGSFALYGSECGAPIISSKEIRFPIRVDFCQGGEACGSHYVDLGNSKTSHGRLSYGWTTSNAVSSIKAVPFCSKGADGKGVSSFAAVWNENTLPKGKKLLETDSATESLVPIQLIKQGSSGGLDSATDSSKEIPQLSQIGSLPVVAPGEAHLLQTNEEKEEKDTAIPAGSPLAYSKENAAYLLKNKIGLPLGAGKTWMIDVPVHGVYMVDIHISAFCGDVDAVSLLVNGVDVLEGERLKQGQSIEFFGQVSLERVGTLEVSSLSQGLFLTSLSIQPATT